MSKPARLMGSADRKHVVVVGSGFAGFTAATQLASLLGGHHDVTMISKSSEFLFVPSLPWVPFGSRTREHITFALGPALEKRGVRFEHSDVRRLDLERRMVVTSKGYERYDYLVIATGSRPNYAAVPGLGPRGYTQSIMTLPEAERAMSAVEALVARPGPVVIGTVQGAACLAAADEFLFAMTCELRARGITERAPITFLTGALSLGHCGAGGFGSVAAIAEQFLDRFAIRTITGAVIQAISPGEIVLASGEKLRFALAMLVPPSLGVDVVRACDSITDPSGFVRVNELCQTEAHPEVFAAGLAAAACTSCAEEMGRVAAHNIAATIRGGTAVTWPSRQCQSEGGAADSSPPRREPHPLRPACPSA